MWPTADQSSPTALKDDSISSALPPTPVSTTAASPARARTYADPNPSATRSHWTAPAGADPGGADGGELAPPPGDGALEPEGPDESGDGESVGATVALPLPPQAAIPNTAMTNAPLPMSARNVRRSSGSQASRSSSSGHEGFTVRHPIRTR